MSRRNRKTSDQKDDESSNIMKKKNLTAADIYDQEFPPLTASASISTNISSTNCFRVNNFKLLLDYIIFPINLFPKNQSTASNENKKQEETARALSRKFLTLLLKLKKFLSH